MKLQKIKGSQKRDSFSSVESATAKKRDSVSSLGLGSTAGTPTGKEQQNYQSKKIVMGGPKTLLTSSKDSNDNKNNKSKAAVSKRVSEKQYNKRVKRRSKSGSFEGKTFFTV